MRKRIRILFNHLLKGKLNKTILGLDIILSIPSSINYDSINIQIYGNNNKITISDNMYIKHLKINIWGNANNICIKEGVRFNVSGEIWIEDNHCELLINNNSTFESTSFALTENNSKINIGSDCMFSYDIELKTGDSHSIVDNQTGKRINFAEDILIGDHVWIGAHSVLLKGTQIANNSIVASNSIVTKSFMNSNTIIGGNPAKIIKENVNWDRKRLSK